MAQRDLRNLAGFLLILLAPLFVLASIISSNASGEGVSPTDVVVSWVFAAGAVLALVAGIIFWIRSRKPL